MATKLEPMNTVPLDDVLEGSSPAGTLNDTTNPPSSSSSDHHHAAAGRPDSSNDTVGPCHKIVQFEPNDPGNPMNWSKAYKWYCTMVVAMTCFVVALASSVITADIVGVTEEFNISEEAALLSVSLFVVGFGVGPMVFAPLSEVFGRRII